MAELEAEAQALRPDIAPSWTLAELANANGGFSDDQNLTRNSIKYVRSSREVDIGKLYPSETGAITDNSKRAYVAVTRLTCDKESEFFSIVANDGSMELYVNGRLVDSSSSGRDHVNPNYFARFTLRPGENTIHVRVVRSGLGCGFSFSLTSDLESVLKECLRNYGSALRNKVIGLNEQLELKINGAIELRDGLAYRILSQDGKTLANGNVGQRLERIDCSGTPGGLLKISLSLDDKEVHSEDFFYGDVVESETLLKKSIEQRPRDTNSDDLDILYHRLNYLLKRPKRDRNWQSNWVQVIADIIKLTPGGSIHDWPGLHIRSYRSTIDGSLQSYRMFYPRNSSKPAPLLIIVSAAVERPHPFIEGAAMNAHLNAIDLGNLAEKHGVAILWSGYRCPPSGSDLDMANFDDLMRSVNANYRIDPRRVTLLGDCSGGVMAGSLAARFPGRFAGIVYLNAIFQKYRMGYQDANRNYPQAPANLLFRTPAYRRALFETDPAPRIIRDANLAILVLHDGLKKPGHGDISLSNKFIKSASNSGRHITTHFYSAKYGTYAASEEVVRWAAQIPPAPSTAGSSYKIQQSRTIRGAFAAPFIVVVGTGGSFEENQAMQGIARSLALAWKSSQFNDCVIKQDKALVESDLRKNLILIGSSSLNSVWAKNQHAAQVEIQSTEIRFNELRWQGVGLSIQAVVRDENTGQYCVLLGSNDLKSSYLPILDLSTDGWYSYAVWSSSGRKTPVDVGILD